MGNQIISKELVIATLNYSGILLSPFEFYSEQMKNEQKEVSDNFLKILKDQDPNFDPKTFKWELGKIDKKFQKFRYSPIYKASAGIHKNELINQQKFKELWMKEFKFYSSKFQFSYTQEEMNNTMMFDLTCYKAIILTVYKKKQLKNMDSLNVQEYRKYMDKFFSKVFLDEKKKLLKVFQALDKRRVDVAFFQQISQEFMQAIPHKYYFIGEQKDQCGILLLKTSFKKVHNEKAILEKYHPEFLERLTWNRHRCISFADNFIFINAHLTSKVEKNHEQQIQLLKAVQELKIMHPTLKIVMGMDANSFLALSNPLKADNFHCYPDHYDIPTTKKTRTWMQPQTSKANEPVTACRDHILSSVPLIKPRVVSIEDNPSENVQYLPTSEHPHDHFVVTASIQVRSIKERMQQ